MDRARVILSKADRVVFFTGAGISAESGIPTFRDPNGLWSKYPPERFGNLLGLIGVATRQPQVFASFLYDFIYPLTSSTPNVAHFAISGLQKARQITVVTQNVDGLHQRAGTTPVIELHGSMFERANPITRRIKPIEMLEMQTLVSRLALLRMNASGGMKVVSSLSPIITLDWTGLWLPNVVLFGQRLPSHAWKLAEEAILACDCFIVVGTSMTVFPAAILVELARRASVEIIHIDVNPGRSRNGLAGTACSILPELCLGL